MIYHDECWLPVAMDWCYTTRFWNYILQVIPGFYLEKGMGYDLRPPMFPKFLFLNNYEAPKNIWTYVFWKSHLSNDLSQWLRTDSTLQGSEIISSKLFRDFTRKSAWDMIWDPQCCPSFSMFLNNYESQKNN